MKIIGFSGKKQSGKTTAVDDLKLRTGGTRSIVNPRYADSEMLLRLMLSFIAGQEAKLKPVADWDLLDINGGPLGESEYFSNTVFYVPTPNLVMIPTKEEFAENRT